MIDITFPLYYYMTIRDIFIYKYGQATEFFLNHVTFSNIDLHTCIKLKCINMQIVFFNV